MPSMPKLLSCAEGHFWETPDDAPVASCPVCGGSPESLPLIALPPVEPGEAEPPPAPPPAKPGFARRPVVPGYEIETERGRSSAGVAVYVAKQALVPRSVLLKVVIAATDRGQRAWGALRGEAAALGKLSHPNIIQLYEAGERNRELFYNAVEFVDGPTLAQKWSAKPLPFRQAAALVEVLARAVHHAHGRGIVHRSLRPAAVHLQLHKSEGPAGEVAPPFCLVHSMRCIPKVADFGLARRPVEGDVNDLDLQQGLPSYLSPEQAWGRPKDIGPATDVYALGTILYELLSGEPPFLGPTVSGTIDLIQSQPVKPPGAHRSGVPGDLSAVCLKCLEKHPRNRYPDAEALADDLRRYLAGRTVKARSASLLYRGWRVVRRHPVATLLLVAVLFGAARTKAAYDALRVGPPAYANFPPPPAPAVVLQPRPDQETAMRAEYVRSVHLADRAVRAGDDARALYFLGRCPARLRQFEWFALWQQANHRAPWRWAQPEVPVRGLAYSPRRALLAAYGYGNNDARATVAIWNAAGELRYQNQPGDQRFHAFGWNGDATSLAAVDAAGLWFPVAVHGLENPDARLDAVVLAPAAARAAQENRVAALAASGGAGQHELYCGVEGAHLFLCRGPNVVTISAGAEGTQALAICVERNWLATGDGDGVVQVWNLSTITRMYTLYGHVGPITALAFSPGGTRLVSAARDGSLSVWDPADGREIVQLSVPGGSPTALAFRDAQHLIVARDREVFQWGDGPP